MAKKSLGLGSEIQFPCLRDKIMGLSLIGEWEGSVIRDVAHTTGSYNLTSLAIHEFLQECDFSREKMFLGNRKTFTQGEAKRKEQRNYEILKGCWVFNNGYEQAAMQSQGKVAIWNPFRVQSPHSWVASVFLVRVSPGVKRHHDYGSSYKENI